MIDRSTGGNGRHEGVPAILTDFDPAGPAGSQRQNMYRDDRRPGPHAARAEHREPSR